MLFKPTSFFTFLNKVSRKFLRHEFQPRDHHSADLTILVSLVCSKTFLGKLSGQP